MIRAAILSVALAGCATVPQNDGCAGRIPPQLRKPVATAELANRDKAAVLWIVDTCAAEPRARQAQDRETAAIKALAPLILPALGLLTGF